MSVMRLGFVHVRVTDMERARSHYVDTLGLRVVAEHDGRTYLKCWDEYDHHSVVLEGGGAGLVKLGYKCETADDLDRIENRCRGFGVTSPGSARATASPSVRAFASCCLQSRPWSSTPTSSISARIPAPSTLTHGPAMT